MDTVKQSCPNCSQLYNLNTLSPQPKGNIPLYLSCGHTTCETCIRNIIKCGEPIDCKICQSIMEVTTNDISLLIQNKISLYKIFPVNMHLLGELTLKLMVKNPAENIPKKEYFVDLKSIISTTDNKQGECIECHYNTSKMCQQCNTVLCDACFYKTHKNFIVFQNHVIQAIGSNNEVNNNCAIHKKPLDYYCQECSKLACMDCLMTGGDKSCKNHNVVPVQEVNEEFMLSLKDIYPNVDETFKRLTKTAVDIGHLLHNAENETGPLSELAKITLSLEQHFSKLQSLVQNHKQEVMGAVHKLQSAEKDSLWKAKNHVEEAIIKSNNILNMIKSLHNDQQKQVNLCKLLEEAKVVAETPWYLTQDDSPKEPLNVVINEDLYKLIDKYVQLEGNADSEYKLKSTKDLNPDAVPPAPNALSYPPELPRDVRQKVVKSKPAEVTAKVAAPGFHQKAPKYKTKCGSNTSLNSIGSSERSFKGSSSQFGDVYQKPIVQSVSPYLESHHPKPLYEGSQELIYISHIVDPLNFFVQRASHQGLVKEMLKEFRNAVSLPKPSVQHITEGKLYLGMNDADNMWQRCRVMTIDRRNQHNPMYQVFYIDFGSTGNIHADKMRFLPPQRVQSPIPLAIHCALANVEPKTGNWTSDDSFLIQKIINNKQAIIHVRAIRTISNYNVKLECDLTTYEDGISLAHALVFHERARLINAKLQYPKAVVLAERPKIFMGNNDFKLKTTEEVYITHIISPDKFYVRKRHLKKIYEELCEDMEQEYSMSVNTGSIYLPEVGMFCVVNVDRYQESIDTGGAVWQRALVTEMPGRLRVRLLLIDTGVTFLGHWSALKTIFPKHTTLAALATECHLAGITPLNKKWSPGSVALLQKFHDRLLELNVEEAQGYGSVGVVLYDKEVDDEENKVCINTEMIKYKFAISFGLFKFNTDATVESQVITNKSPLAKPKPPKPKTDKIKILKKQPPPQKKQEDDELDAKDKGPLRLEAKLLQYISPSLIYVSLVHQQKIFNDLYESIQKYYSKNSNPNKIKWKVGDRCCSFCIKSNTWRRALVLEMENSDVKVFYSDFAIVEKVPLLGLMELKSEFGSIGDAAIKCHLSGVIPAVGNEWPSLTKEFLGELLDSYKRIFITKLGNFKDKSMPVEIWVYHTEQGSALEPNKSEWRCLNKKIIEQGLGVPDKSQPLTSNENKSDDPLNDTLSFLNITGSVRDWLQLEPLPMKPLVVSDSGSNTPTPIVNEETDENSMFISDWLQPEPLECTEFMAMPTYIDNNAVIYFHVLSQQDTLDLIRKALDVRFKNPDPKAKYNKWTVGEPCIALFFLDNKYYRGRVMKVDNENLTCLIHYVDYGNEENCSFENLRKSLALYQIPVQAHKCILSKIQPIDNQWDRTTLDYIHKSIVERECFIKVVGDVTGDIVPVEMKYDKLWINDHLVEFEMATYSDGSKPILRKFAPSSNKERDTTIESDSGPDYIIDKTKESLEDDDDDMSDESQEDPVKPSDHKDWNKIMEEETNEQNIPRALFVTFPKFLKKTFLCNITIINDCNTLELNVIHDEETVKAYQELFSEIQSQGYDRSPLNGIFANKACIALFPQDGLWYRCVILEYSEETSRVKVRYVDYGNIEIVSLADVRDIDSTWAKLPPMSIQAKLDNIEVNPETPLNTVVEKMGETFLDKDNFTAYVIDSDDSFIYVELKNKDGDLVYGKLVDEGIFLNCDPNLID